MRLLFVLIISITLLSSCNTGNEESSTSSILAHQVIVKEVLQTSSYTYLFVSENDEEYWMAASRMEAKVGDKLLYDSATEMKDFQSKQLERVFDRILFVDQISNETEVSKFSAKEANAHTGKKAIEPLEDIQVEPAADGISIAELYKNRKDYADTNVIVRGQVVKFNQSIMNKNWVHLQDGTEDSGNFDLTVTTQEIVAVGDVVTFEGKVSLNKDFGAGYSYELIIESAELK
ncbi:GW dipeptide domain-containing protein [Bacteroidota bacterium]